MHDTNAPGRQDPAIEAVEGTRNPNLVNGGDWIEVALPDSDLTMLYGQCGGA